ncbi:MAG: hypothetical protein ABIK20_07385 [Candidatus Omnitrophota bacterium]
MSQSGIKVEGNTEYIFSMRHTESEDFDHPLYVVIGELDTEGKVTNAMF